jgi:hypothetical protein
MLAIQGHRIPTSEMSLQTLLCIPIVLAIVLLVLLWGVYKTVRAAINCISASVSQKKTGASFSVDKDKEKDKNNNALHILHLLTRLKTPIPIPTPALDTNDNDNDALDVDVDGKHKHVHLIAVPGINELPGGGYQCAVM